MLFFAKRILDVLKKSEETTENAEGVYHVANPDVRGILSGKRSGDYVGVLFDEPVSFSGNPARGKDRYWECNVNLLHPTSQEAWRNRKF